MPGCINRVVLVGNLGADPDTRFTPSGTQVVTANLATDDEWTDRQGVKRQRTEWHRLVLWRRLAEIATEHLHKGSRIHVEGRLQSRSWENGDGCRHFLTEIVVSDLQILDGPADGPAELDLSYGREAAGGGVKSRDLVNRNPATRGLVSANSGDRSSANPGPGAGTLEQELASNLRSGQEFAEQATLALVTGGTACAGIDDDLPF